MSSEREAASAAGRCANHPDRAPIGLCRTCSTPVCSECHVRLDGILHCRHCLGRTARALGPRRRSVASRIATLVVALVILVPALFGVRGMLLAAGLASGRLSRLLSAAPDAGETK